MSIGLDLGTTEFRSIRTMENELVARRCRAVYLVLRDTPGHRRLLGNTQTSFATCGDDLIVFGEEASECAAMLDLSVIPLLRNGRLPGSDPVARQILALMLEGVLPSAEKSGTICCLTVPGGYGADDQRHSSDIRFLKQVVALRGYTPQITSAGLAIVLTELSTASFSGLGISLGAVGCDFSVIHCGRELAHCSITGNLAELADEFPMDSTIMGSKSQNGTSDPQQAGWNRMCSRLLTNIFFEARETLVAEGSIRLIPQPSQIACTGGITAAPGFADLFEAAWAQSGWPIKTAKVRLSGDPSLSIARGCLIQAVMNTKSERDHQAA